MICKNCGYKQICQNCSMYLTFHKTKNKALCHHCSFEKNISRNCKEGKNCEFMQLDLANNDSIQTFVNNFSKTYKKCDILINNAGIQHRQSLEDFASDKFQDVMNTNATALFYLGQAVTRHMKQRGQGKIINIASIMTKMARHHVGAYVTAKAAVGGLTRAMTAEWAAYGINCNAIGPGYISTELTQPLFEDKAFSDWLIAQTPAGRWGQVDDLVGAAIFLSSPASDFMHGQVLYVDGGMTVTV